MYIMINDVIGEKTIDLSYCASYSIITMYITINNIKGEKKLTYLTQFRILTQARKLQLSEC